MENKCYICNKNYNSSDGMHVYYCANKNKLNISKDEIKYNQLCFKFNFEFTKEYLEEKYLEEKWSLTDFKKAHDIDYKATQFLLKYFDIDIRDIGDSKKTNRCKDKYSNTCQKKYGVDNASQSNYVKKKKKETFNKNYGVDNIFKDAKFKNDINNIMVDRYGVLRKTNPEKISQSRKIWWEKLNDDKKNEFIKLWVSNLKLGKKSKLETRIEQIFNDNNIKFVPQYRLGNYLYDFKLNNVLLEVQGDFWHANPDIYKENDELRFPLKSVTAKSLWNKDYKKKIFAEKRNYKLIYIWENELNNEPNDGNILQSIKEKIYENI